MMTEKVKLKDCCSLIDYRGKTPKKSDQGYVLITAKNVKDNGFSFEPREYIPKDSYEARMVRGIPVSGDVLFTTEAPLGNVCRIPEMNDLFSVGQRIVVVRPNDSSLRKDYLEYVLKSRKFCDDMWRRSSGSTVKGIRTKELLQIEIPIPDEHTQGVIAGSLNTLRKIIDAKTNQLEEYDLLIKSRFVEMFGTPLVNDLQWREEKANDVCIRITDGSHFSPKNNGQGVPMLSVKDMSNEGFSYEKCKYANDEDYEKLKKNDCKPLKNDVLIAKDGSYFYYGFVVRKEIDQAVLSSIAILRPNISLISPDYLRAYMMSAEIVDLVGRRYITGAALKRVILKGIREIPVMLPPLELQTQYSDFVQQVDKLKFEVQKSRDEVQQLFDSLMQEYFE